MNIALLERVREQIVMHPDSHDQRQYLPTTITWSGYKSPVQEILDCGTPCCIAGHALILNGLTEDMIYLDVYGRVGFQDACEDAAKAIGLTDYAAAIVFSADYTTAGAVKMLDYLIGGGIDADVMAELRRNNGTHYEVGQ